MKRPSPFAQTRLSAVTFLVAASLFLGAVHGAVAGPLPEERRLAVDRFIESFVELAMFDGSVLIDRAGEVVYERSFGFANHEHGIRHGPRTRFRIASVSKTVTDAAFAVLIQRGALALETPLSRYLPDFPSAERITIGHLLNHTSGIPHSNSQPWGVAKESLSIDEIVERLAAVPLDFEPGSDSRYSNGGYAVAAKVLEVVGGETLGNVLKATVFDPLGMEDTGHIADARAVMPGIATGYEPGAYPGERRHSRFYAVETRPGGGSLYSTVRDLHRFTRAVFREGFVADELRASVLGDDEPVFLSQGRSPGFVGKLYYDRAADLIVVSLSNSYAVPADWAKAIADIATGAEDRQPWPELRPAAPTVSENDPRLGRYRRSRGFESSIERSPRGAMVIEDTRSETLTGLVPLSDGAFLQPLYFQRCEQAPGTRKIVCRMLSGDERYTSEFSPLDE